MASYKLLIRKSAAKELEGVEGKKDRQRIVERIQALAENPRTSGVEKLSSSGEKYRVRQGDYRIVYEIDDKVETVTIVKIGHRKDVYRRL
ncbi:MAG: type II toxin-antitoxin system mRNA interferase toxin, RelE/StbE family [Acidobacteria bacterium]|nr:MAG: type II toxin-antitoxin system mRNA interferase toxin, RelE/StbE family [Acidobacteriota bacterium]